MEQGIVSSDEKHQNLEQKLKDFTIELDKENGRLHMDIDAMQIMVDKLHKKNVAIDRITSRCINRNEACAEYLGSSQSNNSNPTLSDSSSRITNEDQNLYMFRDTSKTVIVSRVAEKEKENLRAVMLHCFKDIDLNIADHEIETVERIGTFDRNQGWPRPVKIRFVSKLIRDQVLYFKLRLRHSVIYHKFQITKEEPKELRINRAKLRQGANKAKEPGHSVTIALDRISIDDKEYNVGQIEEIPIEFRTKAHENFVPSATLLTFNEKCQTKSGKMISVGPMCEN